MKKKEEGVVIALEGQVAKVRASRHNDCESCGACPGDNAMIMDVYNPLEAKVGERVLFEMAAGSNMVKAAFIVYILPLLTAFLGFLIGRWAAYTFAWPVLTLEVIGTIVAFLLALVYVKSYDRSMAKTKMLPVIVNVLTGS